MLIVLVHIFKISRMSLPLISCHIHNFEPNDFYNEVSGKWRVLKGDRRARHQRGHHNNPTWLF